MSNTPSEELRLLLQEARSALWQPANVELCERIDDALARWGTPQPVVREPLTNEQRMEVFNEAMKRCDENLNLPWRVAILEQVEIAHGITKGGQHGTDN